tara:strand:- start:898 stop:1119 length:222 start_codon:yes stop_codon:yes gene_type:complete
MHIETKSRSLAKALSWRIIASITTAAIAYAFGVPMKAVGLIFVADLIIKFLLYFFHERAWGLISFGIKSKPEK